MSVEGRIGRIDWAGTAGALQEQGWAPLPPLLDPSEAAALASLYDQDDAFRSTVTMARHGFGRGEYRYFRYPLPAIVAQLRACLYSRLLGTANAWRATAGQTPLPDTHDAYLSLCHRAGQVRPTPLMLRYGPGDHNCLNQDLYGDIVFPLQVVLLLSPSSDFAGGELVLTEQRPRMQSRPSVVPMESFGGAVFAVARRPVTGSKGIYHVTMRHGVSKVRAGRRQTLGFIFHDAA